ncbi:MAG: serine hydrolase [Eubacteriales bacterium]|nr:serine hydrolase [Eubacteriales bacterium]
MKYRISILLSVLGLSLSGITGVSDASVSAVSELTALTPAQTGTFTLPNILDPEMRSFWMREDTETLPPASAPYTEEDLETLFGGIPVFMDTGSFAMNELYHIPPAHLSLDGTLLRLGDSLYQVRPSWLQLKKELTSRLSTYQGDWSIYLKDLSSEKTMEINEHTMTAASLIKLYIAGSIYEALENDTITMDEEIRNALTQMIVVSDNESSNVLTRRLVDETGDFQTGLAVTNDFIARYGFDNTEQVNGIGDPSLWVNDGRVNRTSAADCGRFLELVYDGKLVSHYASLRLEDLLNRQEVNYKIPDGLPEGVHISHKTGEVDDTENDAAIIYTPYGDYIFCILSTDLTDTNAAVEHIHEVTAYIYDYFTEPLIALTEDDDVSALGKTLETEQSIE